MTFEIDYGNLDYPSLAYEPWTDLRKRNDIQTFNLLFPYQQIPEFYQQDIIRGYYASVTYIDHLIGQILQGNNSKSRKRNIY